MLVKKRSETLLKIILYVGITQKLLAIDMNTTYIREPKTKNIETEQMIYKNSERVDSIRKDKVETRLK